jgi:hypothetical protein
MMNRYLMGLVCSARSRLTRARQKELVSDSRAQKREPRLPIYLVHIRSYLPSGHLTMQLSLIHTHQNYALFVQHHLIYIVWTVLQVNYISCLHRLVGLVVHHTLIEVQA